MAGFKKHRRPTSVTAHVCHRLHMPTRAGGGQRLAGSLGQPTASEAPPERGFWTVKRRLPEAKIHTPQAKVSLDQAIEAVRKAGAWPVHEGDDKYKKQVDLLERRLAKVNGLLENNELEIKRLRRLKTAETGVASKFKEAQGISDEDENAEAKKEMMSQIFSANLKLHQRISSQSSSAD